MKKEKQPLFDNTMRMYREKYNISQQKLANKIGVSRQTINQLEKNHHNPSLAVAHSIATVFRVRIDDVFIFKDTTK